MALTERENFLRNAALHYPEYMPVYTLISDASWDQCREEMEAVLARHPRIWPGFQPGRRDWEHYDFGPGRTKDLPFRDAWGCVWETRENGIEGVVTESPLESWEAWESWSAPDPLKTGDRGPVDWEGIAAKLHARREQGALCEGELPHGFYFMRLYYLRGFANLMTDLATGEPRIEALIDTLCEHNRVLIEQYLRIGVDVISVGDDLGTQSASMIGPDLFRRYCRPAYERLFAPCRAQGCPVLFHSDGYIMDLVDDLLASGVTILNPQDLCNGIENLRRELKGRACIRLDIDRQSVLPYGSRQEIHDLVEEAVRTLGAPEGGLELIVGIYPPTPPENVDALACAFEKFQRFWFGESS